MRAVRGRLTYANVAATFALIISLGLGSAYAADKIGSKDIARKAVKSKHIKNRNVKAQDLANAAVSSKKVADGSLLGEDFAANQLPQGEPGPIGITGPEGDRGPQGLQGPRGAEGLIGYEVNGGVGSVGLTAGSTQLLSTGCEENTPTEGLEILGGGLEMFSAIGVSGDHKDSITLIGSFPVEPDHWHTIVRNDSPETVSLSYRRYVICAEAG